MGSSSRSRGYVYSVSTHLGSSHLRKIIPQIGFYTSPSIFPEATHSMRFEWMLEKSLRLKVCAPVTPPTTAVKKTIIKGPDKCWFPKMTKILTETGLQLKERIIKTDLPVPGPKFKYLGGDFERIEDIKDMLKTDDFIPFEI
jgi:hypothetical protein